MQNPPMHLHRDWRGLPAAARGATVAMGNFDGVHLGHQHVLRQAREAGDRLGIWGFSSLRRDRVFLHRAKTFSEPMSRDITARIGGLAPGHYTRLGAAIRHVSAQLADEGATRRLLLVLTDGKPNDLDHYEGRHGIEDSAMAVREARRAGHSVFGITVDRDGKSWFPRIFGQGGFSVIRDPDRLTTALPEIYRQLVK